MKNTWKYELLKHINRLENYFTKTPIFMHFAIPINIQLEYIFKFNLAYVQCIFLSWCMVPILYGFS